MSLNQLHASIALKVIIKTKGVMAPATNFGTNQKFKRSQNLTEFVHEIQGEIIGHQLLTTLAVLNT
jgi:hypothetical protein